MNFFEEATLRLKQQLKVSEDQRVAEFFGMTGKAWTARKRREAFPEKELYALAAKRPDLDLDVAYVLTGERVAAGARQSLAQLGRVVTEMGNPAVIAELDRALKQEAAAAAKRRPLYERLENALDLCSDSDLQLVMGLTLRLAKANMIGK